MTEYSTNPRSMLVFSRGTVFTIANPKIVPQVKTVRDHSLTASEKDALLSLLDDPSPPVRNALVEVFKAMGPCGLEILSEAAQSSNRLIGWYANAYLSQLKSSDPLQELRAFIQSGNYELETGWIMISRVAHPALDIGAICSELDEYAARCKELSVSPTTSREYCTVINRVLFHELGFRGNSDRYTDPANSFINTVLLTRRGLPITLSLLYVLVATRLGVTIEPINAPGHFVVGCFEERAPFYVDPFHHGKFLTAGQMLKRLEANNLAPNLSHLAPATTHETLTRLCRNLVHHYLESGEESNASLFADILKEFKDAYETRT